MANMHFQFEAIGTHWVIDIFQSPSSVSEEEMLSRVLATIEKYDKAYSRFRPDSLITQMSQAEGMYTLPEGGDHLLDLYWQMYQVTQGKVTPLIGQTLIEAGYDATYSLKPGTLHSVPQWEEVISYSGRQVTLHKPAVLDFGAAGKGDLIDIVGKELEQMGVHAFCIDAGGDILHRNPTNEVLRVGLEHPETPQHVIGVAEISNTSICGSAGNRRKWQGFHHIIDPVTLHSPQHIKAVWVVADSTILADILATCLFFVPAQKLTSTYRFEYVILNQDFSLEKSSQFPAEFFLE